jgi:hypothetical protein
VGNDADLFVGPVPDKEPGDEVREGVGFIWETSNEAAAGFFPKMRAQYQLRMQYNGTIDTWDSRPGREGSIVSWTGGLCENPRGDACANGDQDG